MEIKRNDKSQIWEKIMSINPKKEKAENEQVNVMVSAEKD